MSERYRALRVGILSSIPVRAITLLAPLLLIPYAIGSIGPNAYGLWATAQTVTAFAAFADLGTGNGLLTRLTESEAGNGDSSSHLVASAFVMTSVVALSLGFLAVPVLVFVSHSEWLSRQPIPPREAIAIIAICMAAFVLNVPLALIQRIQYATGHVLAANVWTAVTATAALAAFIAAHEAGFGVAASIAFSAMSGPFVALLNNAYFFSRFRPDLVPRLGLVRREAFSSLLRTGGMFVAIGACMTVGVSLDLVIVSANLTLDSTATYAIALRVVTAFFSFYMLVIMPFWPAVGSALVQGDLKWVKQATHRFSALGAAALAVAGVLMATVFRPLLVMWVGEGSVAPSRMLLIALTAWIVIQAAASPLFMVQNAAAVLWPQLVGWSTFAALSIAMKWTLVDTWGLIVIPLVSVVVFSLTLIPTSLFGYSRSLKRYRKQEAHV